MAKRIHHADEIRELSARLKEAARELDSIASLLKSSGCDGVEVQSDTMMGTYLPGVENWILTVKAASIIQAGRRKR